MTIPAQQLADVDDETIARGEVLYHDFCAPCHGLIARSGGAIADLRMMGQGSHDNFDGIVLGGLLAGSGMASFADSLKPTDTVLVHDYIKARAHADREVALGNEEAARLTWLK
jgi:mono/diheme cytochrome c family protein